jgi:hypothetical protein
VDLAFVVQIRQAEEELPTDNGDLAFIEDPRFQLRNQLGIPSRRIRSSELTRSRQLPPARYSMTIQSLYPRTKLP